MDLQEAVGHVGEPPDNVAAWKMLAERLLSDPCCVFHRNLEISSRYAQLHGLLPTCFKWAAMAAIASHHVRLVLFPLRLDASRTGFVDLQRSLGRRRMPMTDVDTIRMTNNAIFGDIFWAHLVYATTSNGIDRLRLLLGGDAYYAPMLAGFELVDEGRRALEDPTSSPATRRDAEDNIWAGNVAFLEHEQRAIVQPNFDLLSCAFARLISIGSATSFEVRGLQYEVAYFTSFYSYSITRGVRRSVQARAWPRITRFDDRWAWLTASVVPHFRQLDAGPHLVSASLRRILDDKASYASMPCIVPRTTMAEKTRKA